jgi:hypothetical protein
LQNSPGLFTFLFKKGSYINLMPNVAGIVPQQGAVPFQSVARCRVSGTQTEMISPRPGGHDNQA